MYCIPPNWDNVENMQATDCSLGFCNYTIRYKYRKCCEWDPIGQTCTSYYIQLQIVDIWFQGNECFNIPGSTLLSNAYNCYLPNSYAMFLSTLQGYNPDSLIVIEISQILCWSYCQFTHPYTNSNASYIG
jgi:hypothetical protein